MALTNFERRVDDPDVAMLELDDAPITRNDDVAASYVMTEV